MNTASDLEFFVLLARQGSLAAAARELHLTAPALSKRLAQLEARLGVRLVQRTTRRMSLTAEGEVFLARARTILEDIRELENEVAGSKAAPRGRLRINATLGFGRSHIAPLVSEFVRQHPAVEVQLQLTDRPLNLAEQGFDLGLRFGEPPDARLAARKIMSNRRFVCASPRYLEAHGEPKTPEELARHACIIHRQNDEDYHLWRFAKGRDSVAVKVRGGLSSNDGDVVQQWALEGQGLVVRSEWDAAKYLESGRLRAVLGEWSLPPADLYAIYPPRLNLSARLRAFLDFLAARFNP